MHSIYVIHVIYFNRSKNDTKHIMFTYEGYTKVRDVAVSQEWKKSKDHSIKTVGGFEVVTIYQPIKLTSMLE